MFFIIWLVYLVASIAGVLCQCPTQCTGCGTAVVECALNSPFSDFSEIQTQDLTFRCLDGGKLGTAGLKQLVELKRLAMHDCLTSSIHSGIFASLQNLEYLNISQNNIESINQQAFNSLENLISLDISVNRIQTLPNGLFQGTRKLEKLYLDNNRLTKLPPVLLADLPVLKELWMSNNHLADVAFSDLPEITTVDLSYNMLTELSGRDFALLKLQTLDISHNRIELIQTKFSSAERLTMLNLADNRLSTVDLGYFPPHMDLNLSNNLIQTLPSSFSQMLQNIQHVDLSGNPFHCNCDLEHLRVYYRSHRDKMEAISCVTPQTLSFSSSSSPFECTEPSVVISQEGTGLMCQVNGDPAPTVTWYDAQSGESLVTSLHSGDVSVTSNDARLGEHLLEGHSELLCSAVNTAGTTEEKCFVFQMSTNTTDEGESSAETVSLSLFIGCLIGVTVGTLCLVIYVALCCRFCNCKGKKQKEDPYHRSQVPYAQRPYYAKPQKSRKKRKHTSRPWEFPPQYPSQYGGPQPASATQPSSSAPGSENIYASITGSQSRYAHEQPATIEELPSDDDDVKQAIDSPDSKKTARIIELSDTPSTSCTNIPQSTPAQSSDPLPAYTSNPNISSPTPLRLYSASNPDFGSSPLSPPQPSVFAANRRASDRLGFFSNSSPATARSSSMIITGELFVDPRPFQGISMERTWSQEFGHEINV